MKKLFAFLMLFSPLAYTQSTWTQCASEGGTCTFQGTKLVRYGEPWKNLWSPARAMTSPVGCNNTTFSPDPSPGTGKRCEVMDVPLPAQPTGLAWNAAQVTWDAVTSNTDATPATPPLSYQVKMNGTVVGTVTGTSFTVGSLTPGTYSFTVATVASYGMSVEAGPVTKVVTAPPVVLPPPPPCYAKPKGTGSIPQLAGNLSGFAVRWFCTAADGKVTAHSFVGRWSDLWSNWGTELASADTKEKQDDLWRRGIKAPAGDPAYADVLPLAQQLAVENPTPTPQVRAFVVAALTGATSRPAYRVVNGARTSTLAGRVGILAPSGVGTPCDCGKFQSGNYCSVEGQPNVLTAEPSDVLGPSAAVCSEVK